MVGSGVLEGVAPPPAFTEEGLQWWRDHLAPPPQVSVIPCMIVDRVGGARACGRVRVYDLHGNSEGLLVALAHHLQLDEGHPAPPKYIG
ncbi:hypothetical protein NL676_025982 [Syzygium grande]|nr:hypothetical protein NL676_025982 [Syzygium grande]